ncbi:MAG: B12-binding domain-containing radical SAM protein [Alphaproteobacteria bacterium]|nr:B12-binding domain-containing radical SAM protein [Alphaproteobacteria bacterium]
MKIGMLYPSWTGAYGIFGHFARKNSSWPPYGLALLAAMAERDGHEAFMIDGQLEGLTSEELAQKTVTEAPRLVGFTATSPFFHIQRAVAERIKELDPSIITIVGGPHVTIVKDQALLPCFDYAFVGDAEDSFAAFLKALEAGEDVTQVKGIYFRDDEGAVRFSGAAPWRTEIDSLPYASRHLLHSRDYQVGTPVGNKPFATIQTLRGCPWRCIFCASEALNTTRIIMRDPKIAAQEIDHIIKTYGITHFMFLDEVLTLKRDHILAVVDLVAEMGHKITFEGSTRANLVDDDLIAHLKSRGLVRMSFGLETVNADMREIIQKKVPMKHYVEANRILNRHGIEAHNSLMIGLPGETRETVRETFAFLRDARDVKLANIAITVPYPGTELHRMAVSGEHGMKLLSEDFSQYRRYGTAVTEVNGLSPQDLVNLQNEGFLTFYSAPWRWKAMWVKHGFIGVLLLLVRLGRHMAQRWRERRDEGLTAVGHAGSPNRPNG